MPAPHSWLRFHRPLPDARLRLLCFPHAGGGASAYRQWPAQMARARVEVWPVQPPGREDRLSQRAIGDLNALLHSLFETFSDVLANRRYALFGHSVGASVAYAFAAAMADRREPDHLILSSQRPPGHPDPDGPMHLMDRPTLMAKLVRYGGMPGDILCHDELIDLVLPAIRADYRLVERPRLDFRAPLRCPVTVIGGVSDESVPIHLLPAWRQVTTGPFRIELLPGGHFRDAGAEKRLLGVLHGILD